MLRLYKGRKGRHLIMFNNDTIIFQLATHYLPKIALKLESLFITIEDALTETHPLIHHYALNNIIDVLKLIEKPELKSRFLKEFMRIEHALNKSKTVVSDASYADLFVQIQRLNDVAGKFSHSLQRDPFLLALHLAQTNPNNEFELHPPPLMLWLENATNIRIQDLSSWLQELSMIRDTVNIYLSLLRSSAIFDEIDLPNGFYQRALPPKTTCHLILLRVKIHSGIIPKIQLGHHGLSLRICERKSMNEIRDTSTKLDLAICQL